MKKSYHQKILAEAIGCEVSELALAIMTEANLSLDVLRGQIGHDEYHFDNNSFKESAAFIEENRTEVRNALKNGDAEAAWQAFGRLSHTAQDFYAHSNYISLWLAKFDEDSHLPPSKIRHDDAQLLDSPELRSGKLYYPLEILSYIPALKKYILPLLPKDSHAWMNLDSPEQGMAFEYAYAAAVKRTKSEYEKTLAGLEKKEKDLFRS